MDGRTCCFSLSSISSLLADSFDIPAILPVSHSDASKLAETAWMSPTRCERSNLQPYLCRNAARKGFALPALGSVDTAGRDESERRQPAK